MCDWDAYVLQKEGGWVREAYIITITGNGKKIIWKLMWKKINVLKWKPNN